MEHTYTQKIRKRDHALVLLASICLHILMLVILVYCGFDHHLLKQLRDGHTELFDNSQACQPHLFAQQTTFKLPVRFANANQSKDSSEKPDKQLKAISGIKATSSIKEKSLPIKKSSSADDQPVQPADTTPIKKTSSRATNSHQDAKKKRKAPYRRAIRSQHSQAYREITIADLAKEFVKHLKQDAPSQQNNNTQANKTLNWEELKRLSYMQKIAWHIQNEMSIAREKLSMFSTPNIAAGILVTIEQDGRVSDVTILQTSGSSGFDDAITECIKQTSPLPPVPRFLGTSAFQTAFVIYSINHNRTPWRVQLTT